MRRALLLLLFLGSCAPGPTPEPTPGPAEHRLILPAVIGGGAWGPGAAGCAEPAVLDQLGVRWCYAWRPDCGGNPRCVPMFRPGAVAADVPAAMESCGGRCGRALLMNEPDLVGQDNLTLAQQVAFVREFGNAIRAHDPAATIIIGGLYTPRRTTWPAEFVTLYREMHPDEAIPADGAHVHQYLLDCATHDLRALSGCTGGPYPPDAEQWRADIVAFAGAVRTAFGQDAIIILSEWGCLYGEFCFRRAVDYQAGLRFGGPVGGWLAGDAVFLCGDGEGMCCSLCQAGQVSELGAWYAAQLR